MCLCAVDPFVFMILDCSIMSAVEGRIWQMGIISQLSTPVWYSVHMYAGALTAVHAMPMLDIL